MKVKWWGHAAFLIEDEKGIRIITDPYGDELPYKPIADEADIVTISHEHFDHNKAGLIKGNPEIIREVGKFTVKGIKVSGIPTKHDKSGGKERGDNIVYLYEFDGKKIAHLGDLGHLPGEGVLKELSGINILMIPVGGNYTIDDQEAYEICKLLSPEIIIPMHYKTPVLDFPIKGVDEFVERFREKEVYRPGQSMLEIDTLPEKQQVLVLDYVR